MNEFIIFYYTLFYYTLFLCTFITFIIIWIHVPNAIAFVISYSLHQLKIKKLIKNVSDVSIYLIIIFS